jgi:uncharacterized protein
LTCLGLRRTPLSWILFYLRSSYKSINKNGSTVSRVPGRTGKMSKLLLCMVEHPTLTVSLGLLVAFLLLNVVAYRHAWTMTHFVTAEDHPANPPRTRNPAMPRSFLDRVQLALQGVSIERPQEEARPDSVHLAYEVHLHPGGEGQLAAWHIPRTNAPGRVVLYHGYGASKARLLPEARILHDLGYACFLVDFRGNGGSDGRRTSIGYHEAEDVRRSVEYVRRRWPSEPVILFGHSMGAAAVLLALSRNLIQADAVVLECPFDRLLSTVQARFSESGLPAFPAAQLLVFWGGVQHGYNAFSHNPVEYARAVRCPTLLLHGKQDSHVSCAQVEAIYRNLAGEKQLRLFDDIGHESIAAVRPAEWKECVAHFLHRHERGDFPSH